jgi:tetratricopeptide (TPR) repeat protein
MKRILLAAVIFSIICGGIALAQSEADQIYIKAMQAAAPAEKVKLLKEFISLHVGKGSQYDNYAYANLCVLQYQLKQYNAETISLGEKAIAAGGIDDMMKGTILTTIADINVKTNQLDKAKTAAQQAIQHANASRGKEAEAPNAANWTRLLGGSHYLMAQAQEKSKDIKGALESYNQAYTILKSNAILAEVKKIGKTLVDEQKYAEAEQVFRYLAGTGKDADSLTQLAQTLNKQGKQAEALQMFKDMYAKNKTGNMAYNIGIMLANEAKANPALTNDAIAFLLDAGFLDAKRSKACMDLAQSLYFSQDKEWNNRIKTLNESQALINDWTKTLNAKFGEKSEDELTPDEKREYRKLNEMITKEKVVIDGLMAQQKAGSGKFDALVAAAKKRTGK